MKIETRIYTIHKMSGSCCSTFSEAKYANLCALCEFPDKCDYPDKYSGYDGALKCLIQGGGNLAWTKAVAAKSFFGVSVDFHETRTKRLLTSRH